MKLIISDDDDKDEWAADESLDDIDILAFTGGDRNRFCISFTLS